MADKIIIGSDHAGYPLKEDLKKFLEKKKIPYEDAGVFNKKPSDYPDIAFKVAKEVASGKGKGILICGTGTGMVIAANKVKGIRAALAYDNYSAKKAKEDNNTNILCLRGRFFSHDTAKKVVSTWMKTKFSGETRHKRRINKISRFEK